MVEAHSPMGDPPNLVKGSPVENFDERLGAPGFCLTGHLEASFVSAALASVNEPHVAATGPAPTPRFLTLLGPSRALVPWSIQLRDGVSHLSPGAPVRLRAGALLLGVPTGGGFLHMLEGRGQSLRITATSAPVRPGCPLHGDATRFLTLPRRSMALLGLAAPEGSNLERQATTVTARRLDAFLDAICNKGSKETLGAATRQLSGLGPGSTPTGDDLITGAAAAAWALGGAGLLPARRLRALCDAIEELPSDCTTPTAREMLWEAARGYFAEPLLEFVCALASKYSTAQELEALASSLLTLGHTSGADLLAGAMALSKRAAWTAAPVAREAT